MEKPTRVEAGQRWKVPREAGPGLLPSEVKLTAARTITLGSSGAEPRDELAMLTVTANTGGVYAVGDVQRENVALRAEIERLRNVAYEQRRTIGKREQEIAALRAPFTRKPPAEPWVPSIDPDWDLYV